MVDLHIGRHGILILLVLFLIMGLEDILVWMNSGVIPGLEFLIAAVIVLAVVVLAIRQANRHPPPFR